MRLPCVRLAGIRVWFLAASLSLTTAAASGATTPATSDPEPNSPEWYAREAQNFADSFGRERDQLANPAYLALREQARAQGREDFPDPYRAPERWKQLTGGQVLATSFANRYGARLSAHLWTPPIPFTDPVTGATVHRPLPAVVVLHGGGGENEQPYWWAAEDLAQNGYVVLTFDVQGAGNSDVKPPDPDPTTEENESEFCRHPGSWTQPQEMGIAEDPDQECAGMAPPSDLAAAEIDVAGLMSSAQLLLAARTGDDDGIRRQLQPAYDAAKARWVFGALDAVSWLVSDANPLRTLVDPHRIGVVGHSQGAFGAMLAANGDPRRRFAAAVAWDGSGTMATTDVGPRVPTLFLQTEQEPLVGPRPTAPSPTSFHPTRDDYARFVGSGVDTAFLVHRSSGHYEFGSTPPENTPAGSASSKGQRVALYYTLAWLDRYVKGVGGDSVAVDALNRLLEDERFDDSADATSIGQGTYDAVTGNVPYTIEGDRVADHLSQLFTSTYALAGHTCADMRVDPC